MNKLITSIFVLVAISVASYAGIIEHVYTFSNPVITSKGEYQSISFQGTLITGLSGEPALPYQSIKLLLPPGESAESIDITGSNEVVIEGSHRIFPQQFVQPVSEEGKGAFTIKESIYKSFAVYPSTPASHIITSFMNGHAFALSSFTPVHYVPASGKLSYFTSVKVTIHTKSTIQATAALANLRQSPGIVQEIERFADNPQMMDAYQSDRTATADDYDILIITPSNYTNSFAGLQAKYLREGMQSKVTSTETIADSMSGIDLQEKMRNYIIQEYQQHGILHVILGGDDELIPHRGFYCYVQSSSVYEDYDIPADIYFSSLDGNWNTNGDNKWAEPGEDDLLPEVSVGRLSFSSVFELENMLHKTISYQFTPVAGEFQKILLAGENLYYSPETWGSDYLELLIGLHADNGYTTIGIPQAYNINKMYDETASWSGTDLINQLNTGYPILDHAGHANQTYVMKLSNPDITNSNFYNVNGINHNYSIVYTHGCDCGSFDFDDCIAEKMVSIQNFAAAFIGNSRYGWFNEGTSEGPSEHINREFIDALYTDKLNRIGRAHMESKAASAPWVTAPGQWEPGAIRWCFYDCNLLGDPVMAVWTNNPINIATTYPSIIPLGTSSLNVNVMSAGFAVNGLTCVVLNGGLIIGKAYTDINGNATIVFNEPQQNAGVAELVVSGFNCVPTSYSVIIGPNTGIDATPGVQADMRISPNPVDKELNVSYQLPKSATISITLTSADGRTQLIRKGMKENAGNNSFQWNAARLAPGVYDCTIRVDDKQLNQRFIKR
ncbi:MAG: T9SS type A sorting domain-containing protein [Bacteroidetes bacterium]|nr:T9SS type A sorting domain-containing protein [Bacteroidota bacterium]